MTLAETVHYIPKVLRKGNPFHGPFAQLSYMHQTNKNGIQCIIINKYAVRYTMSKSKEPSSALTL